MSSAGCSHGDSRAANATVLPDGSVVWLDMRTIQDVTQYGDETRERLFCSDLLVFLSSFGTKVDRDSLAPLAKDYLHGGQQTKLTNILSLDCVREIWT